ncbi:hypothetical protein BD770DRAFT_151897 [Pilaira anomala]|nr:hypothetical protein BD770DRAFT_151897 [Pilaira anomala]
MTSLYSSSKAMGPFPLIFLYSKNSTYINFVTFQKKKMNGTTTTTAKMVRHLLAVRGSRLYVSSLSNLTALALFFGAF